MKFRFTTVILGIALLQSVSCKKFDEKTKFDLVIEDGFSIPSNVGLSTPFVNFPTPPVKTKINEELEIRNRKKKKIESIKLKALQLSIVNPLSNTFSFLNDVDVYISAEGLTKICIASLHDIPASPGRTISLNPDSSLELEEYIKKDIVDLQVEVTTDETIFQDVDVAVKATFFVDVKVFGI